jgi:hypothetical protein
MDEFWEFTMQHKNDHSVHGARLGILKGKRHVVLVAVVLMIIALVVLHAVAANSIYKTVGFSLKNPLSYLMIAGFLVLLALKVTFLWRFRNSIAKHFKK